MSKQKYDTIIFDLGGVIVNLNTQSTLDAFAQLSGLNASEVLSRFMNEPDFSRYDKGLISEDEFRVVVKRTMGISSTDSEIDQAWNAMIYDIPPHRLDWLKGLNDKFQVYILSNTNTIHINYVHDELFKEHGLYNFSSLVREVYYSHEIGMRKPDKEIYEWVIDKNKLQIGNTIFLDDNEDNINGANEVGINALKVNSPEEVPELLRNEGIEI